MAPSGEIVLAAAARGYIWKHVVQYQHTYSPYTRALILGMNNQAGTKEQTLMAEQNNQEI